MRYPPSNFYNCSLVRAAHNFFVLQYFRNDGFYSFFQECRDFFGHDLTFFSSHHWDLQRSFLFSPPCLPLRGTFTIVLVFSPGRFVEFAGLVMRLFSKYRFSVIPLAFFFCGRFVAPLDFSCLVAASFRLCVFHERLLLFFRHLVLICFFSLFFLFFSRFFSHFRRVCISLPLGSYANS